MFSTRSLRKAIAQFSPVHYSFWTWKRLLPDFVDMHIQAYLTLRDRYEQKQAHDPTATPPPVRAELRQGATLRAKEENHSYEFLALGFYVLQWEVAALMREKEELTQQVQNFKQLSRDSMNLSDTLITTLENTQDPGTRSN